MSNQVALNVMQLTCMRILPCIQLLTIWEPGTHDPTFVPNSEHGSTKDLDTFKYPKTWDNRYDCSHFPSDERVDSSICCVMRLPHSSSTQKRHFHD